MGRKCFIITPIGDEGSNTREKAEGVIEAIAPVLEDLYFEIFVPHRMPKPGSITKQILECILTHELVIANLTELNPNVMYELAVRHSTAKPVITIAEFETKLPFDITTERTIFYTNDMRGVPKLQKELKSSITSISFDNPEFDNPIYRAQRDFKFKETVMNGKDEYIMEQLDELKRIQYNLLESLNSVNDNGRRTIRIIKACRDFDVSLNDIVKYLQSTGVNVDTTPNFKITPEEYQMLKEKFERRDKVATQK